MTRDDALAFCLAQPGAEETYPFGDEVVVCKVGGKMFALVSLGDDAQLSLKCDPVLAEQLRTRYVAVVAGYHLNKRHWNTITLDGSIPDDEVEEMIEHSYELVIAGLSRHVREQLSSG